MSKQNQIKVEHVHRGNQVSLFDIHLCISQSQKVSNKEKIFSNKINSRKKIRIPNDEFKKKKKLKF